MDGGPCKIGAAVVVLSEALSIVFSDDVSSVQAFDRIVEQLMTRKQRAEEILWATLLDVLYRHGDKQSKEEERRRRERMERRARAMEAAEARGELVLVEISEGGAQRRLIRQPPADLAAAIERLHAGPAPT
jgi:sugar phosphate isomerase/epimerase